MSTIETVRDKMGRAFNFALFDVGGTVLGAYLISKYITKTDFVPTLAVLWTVGEVAHLIFKVKTPITKVITNDPDGITPNNNIQL